jgi:hypothetical protein
MPQGQAVYRGKDVTVWYSASMTRNDYGVPGSPVWWEPDDVEVVSVEILGIEVAFEELPKDLQNEILAMADECDWEAEDE